MCLDVGDGIRAEGARLVAAEAAQHHLHAAEAATLRHPAPEAAHNQRGTVDTAVGATAIINIATDNINNNIINIDPTGNINNTLRDINIAPAGNTTTNNLHGGGTDPPSLPLHHQEMDPPSPSPHRQFHHRRCPPPLHVAPPPLPLHADPPHPPLVHLHVELHLL